ncbi:MAG: hypothetical protein ACI9WU_004751 [Myxococcota bacterium]|jgi:hypothetical protein
MLWLLTGSLTLLVTVPPPGPPSADLPPPQCGRGLLITELHIDPGSVADRKGEFVELYNHGPDPVSLQGWRISDGARDAHRIRPDGPLVIGPGQFVVLGANADRATNGNIQIDYEYRRFELRNGSDRVVLEDPCGTPVFDLTYPSEPGWPRMRKGRSIEQARDPARGSPPRWRRAKHRLPSGERATPGFAPWTRKGARQR